MDLLRTILKDDIKKATEERKALRKKQKQSRVLKTLFNDLEFNCIQVAIDHLKDDLEDALTDKKNDSWTQRDLREKFNATKSVKDKLANYEKGGK